MNIHDDDRCFGCEFFFICEKQCEKPNSWEEEIEFLIDTGQMQIEELFRGE